MANCKIYFLISFSWYLQSNMVFFLKTVFLSPNFDVDRLSVLNEQLKLSESTIYYLKTACYAQICIVRIQTQVLVYISLQLFMRLAP